MSAPLLYVVYVDGKPRELAKGDDVAQLTKLCAAKYEGKVRLEPGAACPVADVMLVTMLLLGEWLIAQFLFMQQAQQKVQPASRLVRQ